MQKCIKLRIAKPLDGITWDELGNAVNEALFASYKAANYVIREQYLYAKAKENGEIVNPPYCYPELVKQYPYVATHIMNATEQVAKKKWKQHAKDVLNGNVSLPSFKRGLPVHLNGESYKLIKIEDSYVIDAQLCSKNCAKIEDQFVVDAQLCSKNCAIKRYQFVVYSVDRATKTILNRILSGQYKKGQGQISGDRKNKLYFVMPYEFEPIKSESDMKNVMGVDLGVTKVAYWAFSNSNKRGWIDGSEIAEFRRRIESRRKEIQNQSKYSGTGRNGHGIARKVKPVKNLSEKEANFKNTCNFRYASHIIKEAIKMQCGIIQIEDLSTADSVLKNWTYFDLKNKIINKATEHGIEVRFIDPQYTSQRCSECGHIEKSNRVDQATFVCQNCGYGDKYHCIACRLSQLEAGDCNKCGQITKHVTVNADYNAARNLTILNIDQIIKESLSGEAGEKPQKTRKKKVNPRQT